MMPLNDGVGDILGLCVGSIFNLNLKRAANQETAWPRRGLSSDNIKLAHALVMETFITDPLQ